MSGSVSVQNLFKLLTSVWVCTGCLLCTPHPVQSTPHAAWICQKLQAPAHVHWEIGADHLTARVVFTAAVRHVHIEMRSTDAAGHTVHKTTQHFPSAAAGETLSVHLDTDLAVQAQLIMRTQLATHAYSGTAHAQDLIHHASQHGQALTLTRTYNLASALHTRTDHKTRRVGVHQVRPVHTTTHTKTEGALTDQ